MPQNLYFVCFYRHFVKIPQNTYTLSRQVVRVQCYFRPKTLLKCVEIKLQGITRLPAMNVGTVSLDERVRLRDARAQLTMFEKTAYSAFHDGGHDGLNAAYANETETRQELLVLAAPFFTSILARFVTLAQFEDVVQRYPRWMENIFTRNTVESNAQYMEFMTLSHTWRDNHWDSPAFNLFCQKLHRELGSLVTACDIVRPPLAELRLVVQEVCEENEHNVSDIGYKFGHTMDDDALGAWCSAIA